MKPNSILILMFLLFSCSSKKGPTVSPDEYLKLNQQHSAKHKACIHHRTQVLEQPITETEEAELDDELYFFLRNEINFFFCISLCDLSTKSFIRGDWRRNRTPTASDEAQRRLNLFFVSASV
jgi:hypothetical protein